MAHGVNILIKCAGSASQESYWSAKTTSSTCAEKSASHSPFPTLMGPLVDTAHQWLVASSSLLSGQQLQSHSHTLEGAGTEPRELSQPAASASLSPSG